MTTTPSTMRAMVLHAPGEPLRAETRAVPHPGPEGVLLRVLACGICRTDLHVVDGELREPRLPLVPGHQIVGEVVACGAGVTGFAAGERVGVPWLGGSCGDCELLPAGEENLCDTRALHRLPGRRRLRRSTAWPTRVTASRSRPVSTACRPPRCCAPG